MRYYLLVNYISINMSNSVIVSAGAAESTHILHILKIAAKTEFCFKILLFVKERHIENGSFFETKSCGFIYFQCVCRLCNSKIRRFNYY